MGMYIAFPSNIKVIMETIDFIYSLFNQHVFADAKANIEALDYVVRTNANLSNNSLARDLIEVIRNFSFDKIDIPMFQNIMSRNHLTKEECDQFMLNIRTWKSYDKDRIEPARQLLKNVIAKSFVQIANSKFNNNPFEYIQYLKNTQINISGSSSSEIINFADIDPADIINEMSGKVYPSAHDWINKCNLPANGWSSEQLVLVCMPPGTGKSLFLMGEAISILTKVPDSTVYMLCMGDMGKKDYVIRMGAILSGQSFYFAATHIMEMKALLDKTFGRRLMIEIADAGEITPEDFRERMLKYKPNVFMVDYDANFDVNLGESSSGMYTEFGNIYNTLFKITREIKALGFVAAQPMKPSWCLDVINKDQVGESAKKIHIVDACITGGININSQNHIGVFKMAKNRRGEEGKEMPYIRLNDGSFKFFNRDVYRYLSSIQEQKIFSKSDIDEMINASNRNSQGVTPQPVNKRNNVINPFS